MIEGLELTLISSHPATSRHTVADWLLMTLSRLSGKVLQRRYNIATLSEALY
jgi:hypothetical protein